MVDRAMYTIWNSMGEVKDRKTASMRVVSYLRVCRSRNKHRDVLVTLTMCIPHILLTFLTNEQFG